MEHDIFPFRRRGWVRFGVDRLGSWCGLEMFIESAVFGSLQGAIVLVWRVAGVLKSVQKRERESERESWKGYLFWTEESTLENVTKSGK